MTPISREPDPALAETLDYLDMPRARVAAWARKSLRDYCERRGGRAHYGELMDLFEEVLSHAEEAGRTDPTPGC